MPGVIISGNYEGDRADLVGGSRWKDGYWTLELVAQPEDRQQVRQGLRAGQGHSTCGSRSFDHVQTRHTRHPRPVRVVTQE